MKQYEIKMSTNANSFYIKVWADNKSKATYIAYTLWLGKEIDSRYTFEQFIKLFYDRTRLVIEE